jgi:hypothetical protein
MKQDNCKLGELLGYPNCCRHFFQKIFVVEKFYDTTWPMALLSSKPKQEDLIEITNVEQFSNILWRWMGVRLVPHLPCSFACKETIELGKKFTELGRILGFEVEIGWIEDILSWSVEWSALHGIAEIKPPILKISTKTDATARKYTVRLVGNAVPEEAVPGIHFPNNKRKTANWMYTDNGFSSENEMNIWHKI